jgi:hypothetical protein
MAFKDVKYMEPEIPHQDYEDRLVAFIDVLGFSDIVDKTATDVRKLRHLTAALTSLYNRIWEWEADGSFSSFAFTQFSDSIVISSLADSSDSFEMLLQLLMGVMELVDDYDILVRGGIARGQLIHDRTMVVGPAMVEAYHLESKKAIYSRIIIEKVVKEQIEANVEEYIRVHTNLSDVPRFNKLFKTDEDEWCYLDYIKPAPEFNIELNEDDHLKVLDEMVKKGLESTEEKVRLKYFWLQKKIEEARKA